VKDGSNYVFTALGYYKDEFTGEPFDVRLAEISMRSFIIRKLN